MRHVVLALVALVIAGCGPGNGVRDRSDPNVVEGEDIERRSLQRIEQMLRGQVAGVQVEQRGGSLVIRIRGAETFGISNADPLFVVDGYPIPLGADGALDGLNPRDVESIRVLKNASETAIYGARGANGVILITTLRPPQVSDDDS
ncbi:TonB-dependent receptor plug domain-containing protein [Rubrivirga marina]|uniref:TonB-dependent receptor plug domain-containing protein n=1 Tax=Rubrivirga marina TaxID=1196024 RepID=A0A271IY31_9BACT|nr:TonB-dependent receptor plug domain-containing protein [Rubrivirga marina]PAP75429.1 hypothetical protein BSZ37_02705 [Rubrivirga marina]